MARFRGSCRNKIATNQFLIPFLGNLSYSVLKSFPRGEYNVIGLAFYGMGWLRLILDHFTVHAYNFKFEFFRKGGGGGYLIVILILSTE